MVRCKSTISLPVPALALASLTVFWLVPVVGVEFLIDLLLLRLHHGGVALSQLTEEGWRLAGVAWRLRAHPVGCMRHQGQQAGHCDL